MNNNKIKILHEGSKNKKSSNDNTLVGVIL